MEQIKKLRDRMYHLKQQVNHQEYQKICNIKTILLFFLIGILTTIYICYTYQIFVNGTIIINPVEYSDSTTYLNTAQAISDGKIDAFRTPGYPMLLNVAKMISTTLLPSLTVFQVVVLLQNGIFILSLLFLLLILLRLTKSHYLFSFLGTMLYAISASVFNWNFCILTESISISFGVVFLYCAIEYMICPSKIKAIILGIFPFILVMIRPSYLFIYVAVLALFMVRNCWDKKEFKVLIYGYISFVVSVFALLIYCYFVYVNCGLFTISTVGSNLNQQFMVVEAGIYKIPNKEYQTIVQDIDLVIEGKLVGNCFNDDAKYWEAINTVVKKHSPIIISNYVKECIKQNPTIFLKYIINNGYNLLKKDIVSDYTNIINSHNHVWYFPISYFIVLSITGTTLLISAYRVFKKKKLNWITLLLSGYILAIFITMIFSSMGEFNRLFIIAYPAIWMMIVYIVYQVMIHQEKIFE